MTRCNRFEEEALLRLERGLPLSEHFSTCPDCLQSRREYDRLKQAISESGDRATPPQGWEDRVRAVIEESGPTPAPLSEEPAAHSFPSWALWLAAAAALLLILGPLTGPAAISLNQQIVPGRDVYRGKGSGVSERLQDTALPNDRLRLEATAGGRDYAEIRIYRNDRLVERCTLTSREAPLSRDGLCGGGGGRIEAAVNLAIGSYQALLLVSDRPLPASVSGSSLDSDAAMAQQAGAIVKMGKEIEVR